jgi:hypothetical protein
VYLLTTSFTCLASNHPQLSRLVTLVKTLFLGEVSKMSYPLQALVVKLVKNFKANKTDDDNITLAIGDGANDVSMIRGISVF